MLQFVLGRAFSGKSEYISSKIEEGAREILKKGDNSKIMLIVPEQFALEAERSLFARLGGRLFSAVFVTSFSRLSGEIFKQLGFSGGRYCSDCAKAVLMCRAIDESADLLELYKKNSAHPSFAKTLLEAQAEFKNAGADFERLSELSKASDDNILSQKLYELSMLWRVYDGLLSQSYLDSENDVLKAERLARNSGFFSDYDIYIDEFKGFTAPELDMIKTMLSNAKSLSISLCMPIDEQQAENPRLGLFSPITSVYRYIKGLARELAVGVKPSVRLDKSYYESEAVKYMEQNLYNLSAPQFSGENDGVIACLCQNEYSELDFVAATIRQLVMQGYCYNDIAVILRDEEYLPVVDAAFLKYKIPFFSDKLSDISGKPIVRFVQNVIDCAALGTTTERIFAALKCGMTAFDDNDISLLENYCYVWDIKGGRFGREFTENPKGFKEGFSDSEAAELKKINRIRSFIYNLITDFRHQLSESDGYAACTAIVKMLENADSMNALKSKIEKETALGRLTSAEDYRRSWELLMDMLDDIAEAIGDNRMKAERFAKIFALAAKSYSFGTLPQSADCVIVGSAERIRVSRRKVVFIIGANEGVFPYVKRQSGILTERERKQLFSGANLLAKPSSEQLLEERFIAYKALCSSSQRVYMTARKSDISGNSLMPSELFGRLERLFGEAVVIDADELGKDYFCMTANAAFSVLAQGFHFDNSLNASLKAVLKNNPSHAEKVARLEELSALTPYKIDDKTTARNLFGEKMMISPTRVENFYKCHFKYFCENGLRALPLRKAALNPLEAGNLIHSLLCNILPNLDFNSAFDEAKVKMLIDRDLKEYVDSVMGGSENKTKRFIYMYNRMKSSLLDLIKRLYNEFAQSRFTPIDFEYEISDESDIHPLRLYGENNAEVVVHGKIDRIDCYTKETGEKYIRIVDYKSGKKEFNLNDVLNGLNLQMLIYLHCITKNGVGKYENSIPAGILYMPAGEPAPASGGGEALAERYKAYRMNGLLIDDHDVIAAMEHPAQGIYIPVSEKSDGSFSSNSQKSLISLTGLAKIGNYLEKLIINMSDSLGQGEIDALPFPETCSYCDYASVCGRKGLNEREYIKLDTAAEILTEMEGAE